MTRASSGRASWKRIGKGIRDRGSVANLASLAEQLDNNSVAMMGEYVGKTTQARPVVYYKQMQNILRDELVKYANGLQNALVQRSTVSHCVVGIYFIVLRVLSDYA